MITVGTGKHQVSVEKHWIGDDLILHLKGGEQPHVGAIVSCEPGREATRIRLGTHKDHIVLQPLAETACKKYETTVVAVGGIHIENATKKDIELVVQHCKRLESCI